MMTFATRSSAGALCAGVLALAVPAAFGNDGWRPPGAEVFTQFQVFPADPGTCTQVAAGFSHAIALNTDGHCAVWGDDFYGQCIAPVGTFVQVDAGNILTIGLRADGSAVWWS